MNAGSIVVSTRLWKPQEEKRDGVFQEERPSEHECEAGLVFCIVGSFFKTEIITFFLVYAIKYFQFL
jgi:hypothetical protein